MTVIVEIAQAVVEEELGVTWTVFLGTNSKWATRSHHGNQTPLAFSFFWQHGAHHKAMMFNHVDLLEFKSCLKVLQRGPKISECGMREMCGNACTSAYLPLFRCGAEVGTCWLCTLADRLLSQTLPVPVVWSWETESQTTPTWNLRVTLLCSNCKPLRNAHFLSCSPLPSWVYRAKLLAFLRRPSWTSCPGGSCFQWLLAGFCDEMYKVPGSNSFMLLSWGCCNRAQQIWCFQAIEIHALTVSRPRNPQSRCWQDWLLVVAPRETLLPASLTASNGPWCSWLVEAATPPPICFCHHMAASPGSVRSPSHFSYRDTSLWS